MTPILTHSFHDKKVNLNLRIDSVLKNNLKVNIA